MEGKTEDHRYSEIFFRGINQMLRKHFRQINQCFKPTNIQFDEHGCTKLAIKAVFREEFLKPRKLGCDYHLDRVIDKHKNYLTVGTLTEDGYNQEEKGIGQFDFQTV